MRTAILSAYDLINDLRLHVLLNYFLTVSWLLYSLRASAADAVEFALIATSLAGFAYLLNRYTDYDYDLVVDKGHKKFNRTVYLYLSGLFLLLGLILFSRSILPTLSFRLAGFGLILGIILSYIYSVKTFFLFPVKNYFIIKNLTSVLAKYFAFLIGVMIVAPASSSSLILGSISIISVHLIYELLWDVRDIESDRVGNVRTLATKFGRNTTLHICLLIWLLSIVAVSVLGAPNYIFFIKYLLILMFILLTFVIYQPRYFHLMIYGHLLLNLIFVNKEVLIYIQHFFVS